MARRLTAGRDATTLISIRSTCTGNGLAGDPCWHPGGHISRIIALDIVAIPDVLLTFPIIAAFLVTLVHFACAYRMRVAVSYWQMLGAMIVFMSVQWTVASAAFKAMFPASQVYFNRTRKGGGAGVSTRILAMPEMWLGVLLVAGATAVYAANIYRHIEADLFATILLLQSLPFLSAVALVWLERFGENRLKVAATRAAS